MGKILKYCSSCDEGFADKFQFCPNCGDSLQAFEMKPVAKVELEIPAAKAAPKVPVQRVEEPRAPATRDVSAPVEPQPPAPAFIESTPEIEPPPAPVVQAAAPPAPKTRVVEAAPSVQAKAEEPVAKKAAPTAAPVFYQTTPVHADGKAPSLEEEHDKAQREGGYYLTVIEEKNVGTRNSLLLGAAAFMVVALLTGLVINIFSKDLDVGSIDDAMFNAVIVDDVPTATEQEKQQKKEKDAGGGGGGGQQQDETTKGDLANQTKNPERPPEALDRHDFELKDPPASTQGNKQFQQQYDRFGDPNGRFTSLNNGPGSGGGQGSGTGTGQGSGRGTGAGSGIGSGFGGGNGNGNGNGTGTGESGNPPPRAVGESVPFHIISKPRPAFTPEARQANFSGTVVLRVTFLANGSIGSVSAVKGAPYGLTETAIAAAHNMTFSPAKVNGVPTTVVKSVEYTFTLY
jgi:TonB family protein